MSFRLSTNSTTPSGVITRSGSGPPDVPLRNPPTRPRLFENTAQSGGTPPWLAWDKIARGSSMISPRPRVALGCLPRPSCPPHRVARTQVRERPDIGLPRLSRVPWNVVGADGGCGRRGAALRGVRRAGPDRRYRVSGWAVVGGAQLRHVLQAVHDLAHLLLRGHRHGLVDGVFRDLF